jgi:hypothetical protein
MKMWLVLLFFVGGLCSGVLVSCQFLPAADLPRAGDFAYTQKAVDPLPPVKVIPIWVDKTFGEADRVSIDKAIEMWNYSLNGYIKLQVVDFAFDMETEKIVAQINQGGWLILRINHDNAMVTPHDSQREPGSRTLAFVERVGGHHLYIIRDRVGNEDVFGLALHEMGHLLGSPHVGERLMYPHFSQVRMQCIDRESMLAVAAYQQLPSDGLNYCVEGNGEAVRQTPSSGAGSGSD